VSMSSDACLVNNAEYAGGGAVGFGEFGGLGGLGWVGSVGSTAGRWVRRQHRY